MALPVPSAEELKKIARENHIELRPEELDALESMMPAQMAILDQIDALAATPSESVARYRDRKAGTRPSPKDDPLNAIVTRCSVKGASSGPLKGKRVAVKDSVSVAGNSGERRLVGVEGLCLRNRRDDCFANARRGCRNRRDAQHG